VETEASNRETARPVLGLAQMVAKAREYRASETGSPRRIAKLKLGSGEIIGVMLHRCYDRCRNVADGLRRFFSSLTVRRHGPIPEFGSSRHN